MAPPIRASFRNIFHRFLHLTYHFHTIKRISLSVIFPPNSKKRIQHLKHTVFIVPAKFIKLVNINHHFLPIKLRKHITALIFRVYICTSTDHNANFTRIFFQVAKKFIYFRFWYSGSIIF